MPPFCEKELDTFQTHLGFTFKKTNYLKQALHHPSLDTSSEKSNAFERLEFLGDRVLGLVVAKWLFSLFPNEPEGSLAKRHATLVQRTTLSDIAVKMTLHQMLQFHDKNKTGKHVETIFSDACEALIGAMFLDKGLPITSKIIQKFWTPFLAEQTSPPIDPKSALQELSQSLDKGLPTYQVVSMTGPAHKPEFTITVTLPSFPTFTARGSSKQVAEKEAAKQLLEHIQNSLMTNR